jgi:Uma2 family endonuclease
MSAAVMTYEEYVALPEDGNRYEVIEGKLCVLPVPNRRHQTVLLNLALALANFIKTRRLGHVYFAPFDVVLSDTNIVQPDILFISNDRLGIMTEAGATSAPDLAVEVISVSTRGRDEDTKLRLYEQFGVEEYWLIDPMMAIVTIHRRHTACRLNRPDETLTTPLLPGLAIPLAAVFED